MSDILKRVTGREAAEYPSDVLLGFSEIAFAELNEPADLTMGEEKMRQFVAVRVAIIERVHEVLSIRRSIAAWQAETGAIRVGEMTPEHVLN